MVEPSSSDELSSSKTNGSIVDPSLTAEEGLRLSASSSSESVTTVPPVSRVKEEPENLVLWRQPLRVLHYAFIEAIITLGDWARYLFSQTAVLLLLGALIGVYILLHTVPGSPTESVLRVEKYLAWCLWWVGLGVLSSVGLGTGLHTFFLYLGPHIGEEASTNISCVLF